MSLISSFVPGRVRLRSELLSYEPTAGVILQGFAELPFITSLDHNPATGSLLFTYSIFKMPLSKVMTARPLFDRLQQLEGHPKNQELVGQVQTLVEELKKQLS